MSEKYVNDNFKKAIDLINLGDNTKMLVHVIACALELYNDDLDVLEWGEDIVIKHHTEELTDEQFEKLSEEYAEELLETFEEFLDLL